jgi:hypothetical protein
MRIQPRQQLIDIWRASSRASYGADGTWIWGGRDGSNSISDAEQLLCIMHPATEIPQFRLDRPDQTREEIAAALKPLGGPNRIPQVLVKGLIDYFNKYALPDGTPTFSGGTYFSTSSTTRQLTAEQLDLDVVESFASSITLTLATLGFAQIFRESITQPKLIQEVDTLERLARLRLTAAMTGLLRSFTVKVYDLHTEFGEALIRTVNQGNWSAGRVVEELRLALRDTIAGLRDLTVGLGADLAESLDQSNMLFECGWSWGIIEQAPTVDFVAPGLQRQGVAENAPYLYFTVQALDGIADLFSQRTRVLRLLDDEQLRLAGALQLRWDLTQAYWSVIASFGPERWPLEDIPWRTTDGEESDYFSLLVTSIAARGLTQRRDTDSGLDRLGQVLKELANRGRITRRLTQNDSSVLLHTTGVATELVGGEALGPTLTWVATDFAPLLLKRVIRIALFINDIELRAQMLDLADELYLHMARRRLRSGAGAGLWDQPREIYPDVIEMYDHPSWHHTVRMVESLVFAAELAVSHPLRSEPLSALAKSLLAEAEHLFDQEQIAGSSEAAVPMRSALQRHRVKLRRAREVMGDKPGTSMALTLDVLRDLDELAAAREAGREAT